MVFLLSILSIHTVILLAFEKIIFQNLVNLLQLLVNFILFAILLLVFHKVELNSFIVSLYSGYIASLLMSIIPIIKNLPSKVENLSLKSSLKEILKYGFFAQLSNVIQYLNYRFSFFCIKLFFRCFCCWNIFSRSCNIRSDMDYLRKHILSSIFKNSKL